ncbi:MAG: glycosyltransferase [Planctomycetaceae bacterium]|nr:glycosyltransferase [Planctomycetaceae bacterium]
MRIAIFSWESLHSIVVGGVAVHVTELAAALRRRGNEVHVFARLGQGQTTYQQIHGVHYHRCPIDLCDDFVTEMNNMCNSFGDAKIVFVGDGHLRQRLQHRAHELGVAHAVRFLGAMGPDSDLINLYKSTDVVCVPSRNEPFGLVVLEAWSAGKPVVATHNGGPREVVQHGENGFLVHAEPGAICWGVKEAFGNFAHARWMGERGRVKAAFGFNWDLIAGQTEGIYRELV